jgi:hypothetical protein
MVGIGLEVSADLAPLFGQFAAFQRTLNRQVRPVFFGILAPPVGLPGVCLEIEVTHARLRYP